MRRFHFFVTRLHQLRFFGFDKTLLILPGGALVFLLATGLLLAARDGRKRMRGRREGPAR